MHPGTLMGGKAGSGRGMSHNVSILLLVLLVVVVVLLVVGTLTGFAGLLVKSPMIAVRAGVYNASSSTAVIAVSNIGSDPVSIGPSQGAAIARITFRVTSPANTSEPVEVAPFVTNMSWTPGTTVFIYQDANGFWVTDSMRSRLENTTSGPVSPFTHGIWVVSIIDGKTGFLIVRFPVTIP